MNDSNRRGIYSCASADAFLGGQPVTFTQLFGNTYRGFRTSYHGVFMQEDWRVRRDLTVNLGLRWEFQGGLSEVNQLQSVLDPSLNSSVGNAGTGILGAFRREKPSVKSHRDLAAPRIGIAWNPNGGRLSLRAG